MPKRKITIEEAFKVLSDAGIPLQMKVQPLVVSVDDNVKSQSNIEPAQPRNILNNKLVKITLFAAHSIGSGGSLVVRDGEKQVEHAGVQSYGPGVCTVTAELANHLLSADATARQADEKMLSREQRSYIVVQRIGNNGQRSNVGVQVDNEILEGGLGNLPMNMMHVIR